MPEATTLSVIGSRAVLFQAECPCDLEHQQRVWAMAEAAAAWPGVREAVPGMTNLTLPRLFAGRAGAGDVLELGPIRRGALVYLALPGGIGVPEVLGSSSTQLREGFGGHEGRVPAPGDLLRPRTGTDPAWPADGSARRAATTGCAARHPGARPPGRDRRLHRDRRGQDSVPLPGGGQTAAPPAHRHRRARRHDHTPFAARVSRARTETTGRKNSDMPFSDYKTALVTGASGGMGWAIAERLASRGLVVHGLARNRSKLEELHALAGVVPHEIDVTDTAALARLAGEIEVDVLVNNAGVSRPGSLLGSDAFDIDEQIDVNFRAALHLARLVLPGMMARDRGPIVNVTSMAAHYEFGGHIAYHATKAAMHTVSRQLRVDAFGRRVRVTEISPGRVETDIFARVEKIDPAEARRKYFEGFEMPQVSDIADAVDYAVSAPQYVNIGLIEILPTLQVPGGLRTAKRVGDEVILTGAK